MKILTTALIALGLASLSIGQAGTGVKHITTLPRDSKPASQPPTVDNGQLIGQASIVPIMKTWPDYPAVVIQRLMLGNSPIWFEGLGPSKAWIPVSSFTVQRDKNQSKPHFFIIIHVKQGPWTDTMTYTQAGPWPLRMQFHPAAKGSESSVIAAVSLKSVDWTYEPGPEAGFVGEVVFECDNFFLHAP